MKHDIVLLGGTRFETASKTEDNWNVGTVKLKPSSGSRPIGFWPAILSAALCRWVSFRTRVMTKPPATEMS